MKKIIFICLTMSTLACTAMDLQKPAYIRQLKELNSPQSPTFLIFDMMNDNQIHVNNQPIPFESKAIAAALQTILKICDARYEFLCSIYDEHKNCTDEQWFYFFQDTLLDEMKLLKRILYQITENIFLPEFDKSMIFSVTLDNFEKAHALKVLICQSWQKLFNPQLVPFVLTDRHTQAVFQGYANCKLGFTVNLLNEKIPTIDVSYRFEKMRALETVKLGFSER